MRSRAKIKLEEYIAFHENPLQHDLTINHLNQIINMHGFIKLHNRHKMDIFDALGSIDELLSPLRSTLKESISSCAPLSIEEVKGDLAALEWQECPVQSVQAVKSAKEVAEEDPTAGVIRFICCSPSAAAFAGVSRRRRTKSRKRKSIQMISDSLPLLLPPPPPPPPPVSVGNGEDALPLLLLLPPPPAVSVGNGEDALPLLLLPPPPPAFSVEKW